MITFVATAYREKEEIYGFIASLIAQTDNRWKCIIYCDEPNEYVKNAVSFFNDDRFKVIENETSKGFWGHYNRKHALEELVDTEFIIQTSIQDYYVPVTVAEILIRSLDFDLVYFNCIHNHQRYNVLNSELGVCRIDWGSFALRTSIAKNIGIDNPQSPFCDGEFALKCLSYPRIRINKIGKILTVHN